MGKQLRCCNCNKVIADNVSIRDGDIAITCKCGTRNEVKAQPKEREQYQTKGVTYGDPGPELVKLPEGTQILPTKSISGTRYVPGEDIILATIKRNSRHRL